MSNDVTWYKPLRLKARMNIGPGEILITKNKIYFATDIADSITGGRAQVGVSKARAAVFLKPDEDGYKIRNVKARRIIEMNGTRIQEPVAEITRGERIQRKADKHADGSYVVFI